MKKLLIVRNEINAKQLRPVLTDVEVISFTRSEGLFDRVYDVIMVVDQLNSGSEVEIAKWNKYIGYLKTHLSHGGVLIAVY